MKKVWAIVSALAVANLLGLLGFVGFLAATNRLDAARVESVRRLLGETVAERQAREAVEKAAASDAAVVEARLAQEGMAPRTAAERIEGADEVDATARQRVDRLRREVEDLQRTLTRGKAELEAGWAKLDADRKAFEEMRQRIASLEGSEQFEKALRLYESLKPQQAQALLQQLINQGEIDQAVGYLNAMQTRTASKALAEFKDPAVAADLLERLRTRGLEARGKAQPAGSTAAAGNRTADAARDAKPASPGAVPGN